MKGTSVALLASLCVAVATARDDSCSADEPVEVASGAALQSRARLQGQWTKEEVDDAKSAVFKFFDRFKREERRPLHPGTVLRLSFHDCVRYTDGSGGCDGCLNWKGVGNRPFNRDVINRKDSSVPDPQEGDGGNNGLQDVVAQLERIYTGKFSRSHGQSMKNRGFSRADFWALAGIAAVEYTMAINNDVCDTGRKPNQTTSASMKMGQCLWAQDEPNCKALPSRGLVFKAGRRDCQADGYKASKPERHPDSHSGGRQIVQFMREDFGFNGRETVAIMGAHTIGRFHTDLTGFKYVWTPRSEMSFNNEYYRNMVLQDVPFYDNDACVGSVSAWGEMPPSRWAVKANLFTHSGGMIQWIRMGHIGPDCFSRKPAGSEYWPREYRECCSKGVPRGARSRPDNNRKNGSDPLASDDDEFGGCEKWKFLFGRDHAMLSTDMGLYLDFDVDGDGYPRNCSGLETFTKSRVAKQHKQSRTKHQGPLIQGYSLRHRWAWQECPKQRLAEPPTDKPLFEHVEEFANNQTAWLDAFIPAMEKYLENGYAPNELKPVE